MRGAAPLGSSKRFAPSPTKSAEQILAERLATGDLDTLDDFLIRLDVLHLPVPAVAAVTVVVLGGVVWYLGRETTLQMIDLYAASGVVATANPSRLYIPDE